MVTCSLCRAMFFADRSEGKTMNRIVETSLLALIIPTIALGGFLFLERRNKASSDELLELPERTVVQPKFGVIPRRKR
jgi:hypothetical protein